MQFADFQFRNGNHNQNQVFTSDTNLQISHTPVLITSAYEHQKYTEKENSLPQLPSHKVQYTVWHELKSSDLKGDELKAPRVRDGPGMKENTFYTLRDDENHLIHHSLHGSKRLDHRNQLENWEAAKYVNLSYQELGDDYQWKNFKRILHQLKNVVYLTLIDNGITSLSSYSFPRCEQLDISKSFISSFRHLPKAPKLKVLYIRDNHIDSLDGLKSFSTSLEELYLEGNPVTFTLGYRKRVFQMLPHLQILDGGLKTPADMETLNQEDLAPTKNLCIIS